LQILVAASLVLPISLFSFASWVSYRDPRAPADQRLGRLLEVMQEQALKVFQSMNLALETIADLLGSTRKNSTCC